MKYFILLITVFFVFSCGNKKILYLPEINYCEISKIQDVSHAYLFYDEIQKDSVELNRKNLISTTNWLINVDKRLTLKQAIPHLKFLQEKKKNSSHKNKEAKNYFTCNDTSRQNLGFIEFTDVVYFNDANGYDKELNSDDTSMLVFHLNDIRIITSDNKVFQADKSSLIKTINDLFNLNKGLIYLEFKDSLTFQEYINIKSIIEKLDSENITISNNEFIY